MILTTGNVWARAAGPEPELDWLAEYLSFDDATAHFRRRHGYRGDGKIHCFQRFGGKLPAGFVPMVIDAAQREGFTATVVGACYPPIEPDPAADLAWLRDYQLEGVDAVERERRGIIQVATGGGKTEIFAGCTRRFPCRWLFLVHRNQLVDQAADRTELRTSASVGRVGEGKWASWDDHDVICASFQSLHAGLKRGDQRVLDLLFGAEAVAIDECHVLPADTFLKVINQTTNAYWRVGFSGTPLARGDKRSVLAIGALGRVIHRVRAAQLVDKGVLAKPKVKLIPVPQDSAAATHQGVYGELVVRSTKRNRAIVAAVRAAEKPCMVFVKELRHGRILEKLIGQAGLSVTFVSGQHSTAYRKSHVKRLEQGHFDALIASVVFQEGVDVPDLRSVVIACGGKSTIAALQRVGRGMRLAAGKTEFEVWDVEDLTNPMMARQAQARRKAYLSEKFEVTTVSGLVF